ncbi:MAG: ornithine cyclodeaminase family protein [Anaerovorax sp.]|nr:ornithine cyclodeaminase family protein [Anaerovorax sp.]
MSNVRILNAEETKKLLSMAAVIRTVEQVYSEKAKGDTVVFPLVFHEFDPGHADMDIKSGWVKRADVFGLKLVAWFEGNKQKDLPMLSGTILVCDGSTGQPVGILDGAYITGIRTGAAGALGAKYLARPESENLLIVGAGHVATFQIAATLMLMPNIKKVRIYDPIVFKGAKKMADTIRETLVHDFKMTIAKDIVFEAVEDIQEATKKSDVVITVTPSKSPIILKEWVKPGTHFSCIGADMKGKQEIDGNILASARIFVDDVAQNCNVGEIELPLKAGLISKKDIIGELGHIINGVAVGRENDEQITVYDATGTALLDLLTGKLALDMAEKQNVGVCVTL